MELQPDSRLGHTYLAQLQFRRNDLDGSFDSFEVALGPVEERVDLDYLTLASDLGREQEFARAVAIFERLAKRYDTTVPVSGHRCHCWRSRVDMQSAPCKVLNVPLNWPPTGFAPKTYWHTPWLTQAKRKPGCS